MVRPLATTRDASPAPLRLAIRAAKGGVVTCIFIQHSGIMSRTAAATQPLRTSDERARSIDAALEANMYSDLGGINLWKGNPPADGVRVVGP